MLNPIKQAELTKNQEIKSQNDIFQKLKTLKCLKHNLPFNQIKKILFTNQQLLKQNAKNGITLTKGKQFIEPMFSQQFQLIPICEKCYLDRQSNHKIHQKQQNKNKKSERLKQTLQISNKQKNNRISYCSFEYLSRLISAGDLIKNTFLIDQFILQKQLKSTQQEYQLEEQQSIFSICSIKQNIKRQLQNKFTKKKKYVPFFDDLDIQNKRFLTKESSIKQNKFIKQNIRAKNKLNESQDQNKISKHKRLNQLKYLFLQLYDNKKIERQLKKSKLKQMKNWTKNQQKFQQYFNLKFSVANLSAIYQLKQNLHMAIYIITKLINYLSLIIINPDELLQKLMKMNDLAMFDKQIGELIDIVKNKILDKKILILKQINKLAKMQTKVQQFNSYMKIFVDLYKYYSCPFQSHQISSIQMNNQNETQDITQDIKIKELKQKNKDAINEFKTLSILSKESKVKFFVDQKALQIFNFNIAQNIAVLRNSSLITSQQYEDQCQDMMINHAMDYEQVDYFQEFIHVNDGAYAYINQYRPNIFCRSYIDSQRSTQNLIGKQYFVQVIKNLHNSSRDQSQRRKPTFYQLMIKNSLSLQNKIYLRLRLNFQQFDAIKLKIMRSADLQLFCNNQREIFYQIDICIIPDAGENKTKFGFSSQSQQKQDLNNSQILKKLPKYILGQYYPHFLQESQQNQQSQTRFDNLKQQKLKLVLQDDVISLYLQRIQKKQLKHNFRTIVSGIQLQGVLQQQNLNIKNASKIQDEFNIVIYNESQKKLIHKVKTLPKIDSLFGCIQVRLPIFIGLGLATTIPEIQILDR